MKSWPFAIAVCLLVGCWVLIDSLASGESTKNKKSFQHFPLIVGDRWMGKELGLEQKVLNVLKLTDYMMRVYWPSEESQPAQLSRVSQINTPGSLTQKESATPVWLYVGYYENQRTGSTYHSPKNCLPGAGVAVCRGRARDRSGW